MRCLQAFRPLSKPNRYHSLQFPTIRPKCPQSSIQKRFQSQGGGGGGLGAFDLQLSQRGSKTLVKGYTDEGFTVNDVYYEGSIVLLPTKVLHWWDMEVIEKLTTDKLALATLIHPGVRTILLGTGKNHIFIDPKIHEFFRAKGIIIEVMSSKHAISTFNFLVSEGRDVAAFVVAPTPETKRSSNTDWLVKSDPRYVVFDEDDKWDPPDDDDD